MGSEPCAAKGIVLDRETWEAFPVRGQAVVQHEGFLYVIGGKRGKLPSTQMHILSLDRIWKGTCALHLSVPMPFEVWDHAACVVPALPGLPHGCILVVGGRVQAQQGFSEAIHVIDLDPRTCHAVKRARLRASADMPAGKAFVLRSGCALLAHPWSPNHIIMHGGRSTADVQQPSAHAPPSREKLVLSDWHLLSLSPPSSSSATVEVHATPLRPSSAVTQARLQTCKHCLVPATAAPHGKQLPVAVCGGSRGLTTPRPCTMVTIDVADGRVALADGTRISALQAITPSLQHALSGGSAALRSGRGAAFLLPGASATEDMQLCVAAVSPGGLAEVWKGSMHVPVQDRRCAWAALCVAANGARGRDGGRVVAVAQCTVNDKLEGVYAWFADVCGGAGGVWGSDGAKQARKLLLSPVDAAARVQQARKEAEASFYTGEYALPSSGALQVEPFKKGTKRERGAGGCSAPPKRPPVVTKAAKVHQACMPPVPAPRGRAVKKRSGGGSTDGSRRSPAADTAEHDSVIVQDTLDTHASDAAAAADAAGGAPVLGPGMVAIAAEEEQALRARCAEVAALRRDAEGLRLQVEAAVLRGDEQEAAAARLQADVLRRDGEAAQQAERLAAARAEAVAAQAEVAGLRERAEQLARDNVELTARVSEAEVIEKSARTLESELTRLRDVNQRLEAKYAQEQQQRRALQGELSTARDTQRGLEAERTSLQQSLEDSKTRCAAVLRDQEEGAEKLEAARREREQVGRELSEAKAKFEAAVAAREKLQGAYAKLEKSMEKSMAGYAQELRDIKESHESHVGHLQDALRTRELREQVLEQQHKAAVGSLEAQVTSVTQRANIYQEVANSATAKREELEAALAEAKQAAEGAAAQVAELEGKVAAAEAARDDADRRGQKLQQRVDAQKQQLQAEEAQRREAQRTSDSRAAEIEQLQAAAAVAAEEKAELVAYQQSADALREKYQRMAELAGDMQRVALETQRGHANAQMRLGHRASSAPSGQGGSG